MKRFLIISAVAVGSLLLLAAVGLFILWRASQVVPEFYTEVLAAEPAKQRDASDKMLQKTTVLASDLRKSGRWEALFTQQEINGWLAIDLNENHADSLPPGIADPRVAVEASGMRVACRAQRGSVETVLSIALDVYLAEPNVVGIRIRRVRAGVVPLPLADVLEQIRDFGNRMGVRIRWQQFQGDPVALIRLSPVADDKPVIIDTLELAEGEVYLAGITDESSDADSPADVTADGLAD
jgi:hypothetical protein